MVVSVSRDHAAVSNPAVESADLVSPFCGGWAGPAAPGDDGGGIGLAGVRMMKTCVCCGLACWLCMPGKLQSFYMSE